MGSNSLEDAQSGVLYPDWEMPVSFEGWYGRSGNQHVRSETCTRLLPKQVIPQGIYKVKDMEIT